MNKRFTPLALVVPLLAVQVCLASDNKPEPAQPLPFYEAARTALRDRHYLLRDPIARQQWERRPTSRKLTETDTLADATDLCQEIINKLTAEDEVLDPIRTARRRWLVSDKRGDVGFTVELAEQSTLNSRLPANATIFQRASLLKASGEHPAQADSPKDDAKAQGLQGSDRLLEIDGENTIGRSVDELDVAILGERDSVCHLVVERKAEGIASLAGDDKGEGFTVRRLRIKRRAPATPVSSRTFCDSKLGELGWSMFPPDAVAATKKALETDLKSVKGIELDLRHTAPGSDAAVEEIAAYFLKSGVLVQTHMRVGDKLVLRTLRLTETSIIEEIEQDGGIKSTSRPRPPLMFTKPMTAVVSSDSGRLQCKLAAILAANGRLTILGEKQQWKAFHYDNIELPGGWSFNLATGIDLPGKTAKAGSISTAPLLVQLAEENVITDPNDMDGGRKASERLQNLTGVDEEDDRYQYHG